MPTDPTTTSSIDPSPSAIVPLVLTLLDELVAALPLCAHRGWWATRVTELDPAHREPAPLESETSPVSTARSLISLLSDVLLDLSGGCRCWPSDRAARVRVALVDLARVLGFAVFGPHARLDDAVVDAHRHVARVVLVHHPLVHRLAGRAER